MLLLVLGIGHVERNLNNIRLGVKMGIIRFLWHDFFVIIYFWTCLAKFYCIYRYVFEHENICFNMLSSSEWYLTHACA